MEHLALEIFDLPTAEVKNPTTSKYATLEEDASITIIDTSEIFASGDVWSYSFRLNARANAHIMGSVADLHGSRLHDVLDHRRARLWMEGIAVYLGYLRLGDEAEVDSEGNIDVTFESGQKTFEEMIEGAKANQVPMMDDVMIGMALWQKRKVEYHLSMGVSAKLGDFPLPVGTTIPKGDVYFNWETKDKVGIFQCEGEQDGNATQQYPRMVFPKGVFLTAPESGTPEIEEINCINTDYPYDDEHPYCNVALCYQRSGYERKQEDGSLKPDYSQEPEAQRGYEVMPANRVNSAPNFYVIYWIRALMKHLGIYIEENQMMDVEDLRRLFFVNTKCQYVEPKYLRTVAVSERFGRYKFRNFPLGGYKSLVPEYCGPRSEDATHGYNFKVEGYNIDVKESKFDVISWDYTATDGDGARLPADKYPKIESLKIWVEKIINWSYGDYNSYKINNGVLHKAIASSECFPDVDISEVIKAIEDGFGIRFLFSDDYKRVRIVLLRNIFNGKEIQEIQCDVLGGDEKTENSIRGFRMTYGNTDDTQFYYKGFNDKLPHKKPYFVDDSDKHDYSHWNVDVDYGELIQKISAFDKTCSVTPVNGNAYVIKIDKDAKRYEELHPSLFECAGFMDAEDGDCSGEEETIHEISLGFSPAIMNDVNFENERNGDDNNQKFALFVDASMRPRRVDFKDGTDYNDPDAYYDIYNDLYAKKQNDSDKYVYGEMMADDGIIKPGEFAIKSDAYVTKDNLSARLHTFIDEDDEEAEDYTVYYNISNIKISGFLNEGYRLYLQDNFEPNDDGVSPIETKDWGLTLGIMRGSGSDAYVDYSTDPDEDPEENNDTWEKIPGSSVTSHPDTCDSYGNEWDYNGSMIVTPADAPGVLEDLFPNSDAPFNDVEKGYITNTMLFNLYDAEGNLHHVLVASGYSISGVWIDGTAYNHYWSKLTLEELQEISSTDTPMIVEVDSSHERGNTLVQLCALAYGGATEPMKIDNGVGSRYGRISLKLRAQKPNPYFDATQPESASNKRYLEIDNENLRQRGLIDAFYKEYSYWMRNARICKRTVRMTLADLLKIDKTKKVKIGDITGFVRKIQYTVSKKTGLGMATFEIMYI